MISSSSSSSWKGYVSRMDEIRALKNIFVAKPD